MKKLVRKASNPTNQIGFPGVSAVYLKEILGSKKRVECLYQMMKPLRFVKEAVSLTDVERNRFLYVNPAWIKLYGYSARQVLGKDVAPLINSPDIPSGVLRAVKTQTRKGNWEGYLMNRNKKGDEFTVNLRTACLTDSDNKTLGMIGLATVFNDEVAHGASPKKQQYTTEIEREVRNETIRAIDSARVGDIFFVWSRSEYETGCREARD